MRIEDAQVRHLQAPLSHEIKTAFGTMTTRHAVFLVLRDEDGHRGLGESWVNFPLWGAWGRVAAFQQVLIPHLKGRQLDDIPAFTAEVYQTFLGAAQQSGTVGPLLQAICAVEAALWDVEAQREGVSLARLLFRGPLRRVRVYASAVNSPIPWDLIDEHLARGVTLFKLKLGFDDERDRRSLESLHRYLGNRASIAVDVNRAWSVEQALGWLDILRDHDVQWLEEPLRIEDEDQLGLLRDRGSVDISAGENILMPPGCDLERIASAPVDILQPDLTKYAPLHVVAQLLELAKAGGKRIIPHILGSAPGQAASLHFAAGCEDGLVEWDINRNPLRTAMFEEPFEIQDGAIEIPNEPGLGWHLKA